MRSVRSRRNEASSARRTYDGAPRASVPSPMSIPNLVASTTRSPRVPRSSPLSPSDSPPPPQTFTASTVDVGRVEQGDPGVERGVDHLRSAVAIEATAEVVAPKPYGRDGQPGSAERVLPDLIAHDAGQGTRDRTGSCADRQNAWYVSSEGGSAPPLDQVDWSSHRIGPTTPNLDAYSTPCPASGRAPAGTRSTASNTAVPHLAQVARMWITPAK